MLQRDYIMRLVRQFIEALEKLVEEKKKEEIYDTLLSYKIPCLVFCRALKPDDMLLQKATEANLPVF